MLPIEKIIITITIKLFNYYTFNTSNCQPSQCLQKNNRMTVAKYTLFKKLILPKLLSISTYNIAATKLKQAEN